MSVLVFTLVYSVIINVICFLHRNIVDYFFLIHLFVMATWKNKDRCGKWYSGHAVPSLAVCEGETDVNELLSFG